MDFREPQQVGELLRDLPCPWYVCGGWALDLFLGRVTRVHKDVDVAIARTDQTIVQRYLRERGWRLEKVHRGQREPWEDGERLAPPVHGVWCWNEHHRPTFFELLLDEIDAEQLRFRRDPVRGAATGSYGSTGERGGADPGSRDRVAVQVGIAWRERRRLPEHRGRADRGEAPVAASSAREGIWCTPVG